MNKVERFAGYIMGIGITVGAASGLLIGLISGIELGLVLSSGAVGGLLAGAVISTVIRRVKDSLSFTRLAMLGQFFGALIGFVMGNLTAWTAG